MTRMKLLMASLAAVGLLSGAPSALAHCDSADGPVAQAVARALESGNVNPVLAYAPATSEAELRAAFERSRQVRTLSPQARVLADDAFLETAIRLHRAGEGAPFTGVKPAGIDYGPAIPAAEHAVETGDLSKLSASLVEEIDRALRERLAVVQKVQKASKEPKEAREVAAARERISAELDFITFAESVRQAALGRFATHDAD